MTRPGATVHPPPQPHAESLARIPLVAQFPADPAVVTVARGVDRTWQYHQIVQGVGTGFNPFRGEVYYANVSCFADWLRDPYGPSRDINTSDRLIHEVLFAVHDYLHSWATLAICEEAPELQYTTSRITPGKLEAFVFCHLLTEAVATVGLDYWYLSTCSINEVCPIGTRQGPLTVSYRLVDEDEYRRFQPDFAAQRIGFLRDLTRFYCTGRWQGINVTDVKQSPKLLMWLYHELAYGKKQRIYTRQWLAFLSCETIDVHGQKASQPAECNAPWQEKLMAKLGERLWEKVNGNDPQHFKRKVDPAETWRSPLEKAPDFRFVNANCVALSEIEQSLDSLSRQNAAILAGQFVIGHDFRSIPRSLHSIIRANSQQPEVIIPTCKVGSAVACNGNECRDIMLLT